MKQMVYGLLCLTFISTQAHSEVFDQFPVLKETINLEKTYSFTFLIMTCGAVFGLGDSGKDKQGDEIQFYLNKASNVSSLMLGEYAPLDETDGYIDDVNRLMTEVQMASREYDVWSRLRFICGDHR